MSATGTPDRGGVDFDHTSFAVHDALAWARRLRRAYGAVPIAGETLPEFRYLLLYVGTADSGSRIELIEPAASGFLSRYLDRRGEGPHHLTFTVPDLGAAVDQVRKLGLQVTGEDYTHAPWQEAFIAPDAVHGVVIQLAQTDLAYPSPRELLSTRARKVDTFPTSAGATDKTWWTDLWDTDPGTSGVAEATHLTTRDLALSKQLFSGILGAKTAVADDDMRFSWPGGVLDVHAGDAPGITAVHVTGSTVPDLTIGPVRLGCRDIPSSVADQEGQ